MCWWFWIPGEAGLSQSGIPPQRAALSKVDVSDFNVTYAGKKVHHMWVGRKTAGHAREALDCLRKAGRRDALRTYHGAYNRRHVAGTGRWSLHAWGHAIDINIGMKQPDILVECFEKAGFEWGGRWPAPRTDTMHFQIRFGGTHDK